jgi:hypothetical protein
MDDPELYEIIDLPKDYDVTRQHIQFGDPSFDPDTKTVQVFPKVSDFDEEYKKTLVSNFKSSKTINVIEQLRNPNSLFVIKIRDKDYRLIDNFIGQYVEQGVFAGPSNTLVPVLLMADDEQYRIEEITIQELREIANRYRQYLKELYARCLRELEYIWNISFEEAAAITRKLVEEQIEKGDTIIPPPGETKVIKPMDFLKDMFGNLPTN